jgi:putative aldouronate transport system substrate-binding protein
MRFVKRLIPVSLALFMLAGTMAGCSKKNVENSSSSSSPVPIKIFANFGSASETKVDKAWQANVEKALNVTITWEVPPSSGYTDRLQVMLAGGSYPDVVYFADPTAKVFTDAVNNGVVIPITKYINNSANIKKYSYDFSLDALKVKGTSDIYGIPRTTIQRGDGFIIRKDWADNVGFTIPSDNLLTIDQFKDLMTKFTKNDPDKDGKNDTYGWAGSADGNGNLGPIMGYAFGDFGWQKSTSGSYEYINAQNNQDTTVFKNILQFNQDLFKGGLIDPNAPSIKSDAAKQRFYQGVTGAIVEFSGWITQYVANCNKVNPNAKLTYISGIKNAQGKFQETSYGTGVYGLWGVTSACKNPATAVKFFDYLLSDKGWPDAKYGPEGVGYTVSNGVKTPTADYADFSASGWARNFVRRNNDPSFFVALDTPADYVAPVTKWIDIAIKAKVTSLDYGYRPAAADNPTLIDYGTKASQTIAKIITGALPVSAWDDSISGWYKAGGKDYVTQMNTQIKKTEGK